MKVSLDFDGVLSELNIFLQVKELIKSYPQFEWVILTSRKGKDGGDFNFDKIHGIDNSDLYLVAKWLGLYNPETEDYKVLFTNLQWKSFTIDREQISLHLDDWDEEKHRFIVYSIEEFKGRLRALVKEGQCKI